MYLASTVLGNKNSCGPLNRAPDKVPEYTVAKALSSVVVVDTRMSKSLGPCGPDQSFTGLMRTP